MSSLLSHKSIRITKPTHGHQPTKEGEMRPVDVLLDRNQQWKHITKSLKSYYEGLAHISSQTSKEMLALMDTIQVPFHEGNQFMGEPGGWQSVLYEVRDKNKLISEYHASLALTLEKTVVKELEGVRQELKAHILAIEKEANTVAKAVDEQRAISATHLTQLQSGIDTYETSATQMLPQHDPYITSTLASRQLQAQLVKENELTAALIRFQQQQPSFEAGIHRSIQSASRMYDDAKALAKKDIEIAEEEIRIALQSVAEDAEYNHYAAQAGAVIDPDTPFRNLDAVTFPGQNHASTISIKEGVLERKKRFTKTYKESYYVLTPSGYLHERKSNDNAHDLVPTFSLFLPECSLGPPSLESAKSHKFHVEGNKAVKSSFEGKMKHGFRFGSKEIAYSFRARTHSEMMTWWNHMDALSRDTKTAVSVPLKAPVDPISSAVANVGYAAAPVVVANSLEPSTPTRQQLSTTDTPSPIRKESSGHSSHHHHHSHAEGEEYDDEGGSSAEEEEELATRTAPTTPYVQAVESHTSPLDHEGQQISQQKETLPHYVGDGTTTAEKASLAEKGIPALGAPVPSTSTAPPVSPVASSSGGGLFGFLK